MNSNRRVLHVVPDSLMNRATRFVGSSKDIRGRTEYFQSRGIPFDELVVNDRSDAFLEQRLRGMDLTPYGTVLVELPLYPQSMRFLRKHARAARVLLRPINAELFHRLDAAVACLRHLQKVDGFRLVFIALRRLALDFVCARRSDAVLSITLWESEHYWKYFGGSGRVHTVPYFLPQCYAAEISHGVKKRKQCCCLTSCARGTLPFLVESVRNFTDCVRNLGARYSDWEFVISGSAVNEWSDVPERLRQTGFVDNPLELLAESRVMAVLSERGFGFKTKILDAICCGCRVMVTRGLFVRLPVAVQPYCLVVDPRSSESFEGALDTCLMPFPAGDANAVLKQASFRALDEVFSVVTR